jgi:hypothetical protein
MIYVTSIEYAKTQLDSLPESAIENILEFIRFQRFTLGLYDDDTDYLMSIPGMADKIKDGMNTPLSECIPLAEVWSNV